MECAVCLEHLEKSEKLTLKCNHSFHTNCLIKLENHLCPLCRKPFSFEDFGYKLKKICYGNHQYGYSPYIKDGPCRICMGYKITQLIKN